MERTHEAVVFGDKIEWDAVPFGDPEWLYALNRHTCFLILGKAAASGALFRGKWLDSGGGEASG